MQPIGIVCKQLIWYHQEIIPVEFGQIPKSGSGEKVVKSFPYITQCKIVPPGRVNLTPTTFFEQHWYIILYTKYERSGLCSLIQEDF